MFSPCFLCETPFVRNTKIPLKIQSYGEVEHSLAVVYFVVLYTPGVVETQEITKNTDTKTQTKTSYKRIHLSRDFSNDRPVGDIPGVEAVIFRIRRESRPSGTEVSK